MAGVTDKPFRSLCRAMGADLAVCEMVKANDQLYATEKTQRRLDHRGETGPISVQIVGNDPAQMAEAARRNADNGADIIDINMGCPAKKVCNKAAGSALLADPEQVQRILQAVVGAVELPVTLKIRTGTDAQHINASLIGHIAQDEGIKALAVHGRTRAQRFTGNAEHDTTAALVQQLDIPVLANGDINSAQDAAAVLRHTGAAGLLIGRGAQGNPWLFTQIKHFLRSGTQLPPPSRSELQHTITQHVQQLIDFYGEYQGARIARKHIGWYAAGIHGAHALRQAVNQAETVAQHLAHIDEFFSTVAAREAA